jgi:signal transduction histidine kinase
VSSSARVDTASRYRLLLDLARDVTGRLDLAGVLEHTFIALREIVEFTGGSIQLVDTDGMVALAATDPPATIEALSMRIPIGHGIGGGIVATGEPRYLPDITAESEVTSARRRRSTSQGVRSYFGVPLITEGRPIGLVQIDSTVVDAWSEEDRLVVLAFTPIIAAAVQNARLFEREAEAVLRLQELDRHHRDFVAVVSHELRTPLTTVLGYADTILRHLDRFERDQLIEIMTRCRDAASRLTRLVQDLVDLSVIESGTLKPEPVPVDLRALLDEIVASYVPAERQADTTIETREINVVIDAARVQQIVGNLVGNSAKYSAPGTPIAVRAKRDGDNVVFEVADRGRGIPAEHQARIFDRFVQLEDPNVRTAGGFGIGLYVVARLVQALGGTIELSSEVGVGSTFTARLPLG